MYHLSVYEDIAHFGLDLALTNFLFTYQSDVLYR